MTEAGSFYADQHQSVYDDHGPQDFYPQDSYPYMDEKQGESNLKHFRGLVEYKRLNGYRVFIFPLRLAQVVGALILFGMSAYLMSEAGKNHAAVPSLFIFTLAVPIITLLSSVYHLGNHDGIMLPIVDLSFALFYVVLALWFRDYVKHFTDCETTEFVVDPFSKVSCNRLNGTFFVIVLSSGVWAISGIVRLALLSYKIGFFL